jgi:hypothetical protein
MGTLIEIYHDIFSCSPFAEWVTLTLICPVFDHMRVSNWFFVMQICPSEKNHPYAWTLAATLVEKQKFS